MKNIFIRFFEDKDSQVPTDSRLLLETDSVDLDATNLYLLRKLNIEDDIAWWLKGHPNGKVDFVSLGGTTNPPTRRLSPIEMMVDKATGYNKVRQNLVTLRCPRCKTEKQVTRDESWPSEAAVVLYPCPSCHPIEVDIVYLDSNGNIPCGIFSSTPRDLWYRGISGL